MTAFTGFPALLERFFTQRLIQQRQVSPHTISSYRDTFRMFLKFAQQRLRKAPSSLTFEQMDAPLIVAFLDHLEKQRRLTARSPATMACSSKDLVESSPAISARRTSVGGGSPIAPATFVPRTCPGSPLATR